MTADERKAVIKSLKGLSLEQLEARYKACSGTEQALVLMQISQAYRKVRRKQRTKEKST